jgi:hypothetical protein
MLRRRGNTASDDPRKPKRRKGPLCFDYQTCLWFASMLLLELRECFGPLVVPKFVLIFDNRLIFWVYPKTFFS